MTMGFASVLCALYLAGCAPKNPTYGFCCVPHDPPKAAQSGYIDEDKNRYCKVCFKEKCPELYAQKALARKRACSICSSVSVLVGRICKPCRSSRTCGDCGDLNEDPHALACIFCASSSADLGTHKMTLALWCSKCTSDE